MNWHTMISLILLFWSLIAVYVKGGETVADLPAFDDFQDKPICVPEGSGYQKLLDSKGFNAVLVDNGDDAVTAAGEGKLCIGFVRDSGISVPGFTQGSQAINEEPLGIFVSKDLPASAYSALSAIVSNLIANGTLQEILAEYPVPSNPRLDLASKSLGEFVVNPDTPVALSGGQLAAGFSTIIVSLFCMLRIQVM